MAGVSLGGMHTWLCAALDKRVAAAAPLIGVQGFQWAISNNAYHARVDSLKRAFQMIAKECGKVRQSEPATTLVTTSGTFRLKRFAIHSVLWRSQWQLVSSVE